MNFAAQVLRLVSLVGLLGPLAAACQLSASDDGDAGTRASRPAPYQAPGGAPSSGAGRLTSIVFLRHSVGSGLIGDGGLRPQLTDLGYDFYDQGYNEQGLTLPNGEPAGYGYQVPDDNTDPDGLAAIFSQDVVPESVGAAGEPANTLTGLMRHDVIMFKSCFPVSGIASDEQLGAYKSYYLRIRSFADAHPERLFIALTPPPLEPGSTNAAEAQRARAFADWLTSPEFVAGRPNTVVFNLFDQLAESEPGKPDRNMLRAAYRPGADSYRPKALVKRVVNLGLDTVGSSRRLGAGDSHPNARANRTVAPILVNAVDAAIQTYAGPERLAAAASGEAPVAQVGAGTAR